MIKKSLCHIDQKEFYGWKSITLKNDWISLTAVPDIGGRIMAYNLGPYPFIYINSELAGKLFSSEENYGDGSLAAWKNYGGDKTWPAPQGWDGEDQWPGPPDPVLDTGRYSLTDLGKKESIAYIKMESPSDKRSGLQISRKATIYEGSSRVTLDINFKNISERIISWSIWDVLQLDASRRLNDGRLSHEPRVTVSVPVNPNSVFPKGYNVMFGKETNPQWKVDRDQGILFSRYQYEIGKIGMDSPGWIAFSNAAAGFAMTEQFDYYDGEVYPDGGASVECWTVGKGKVLTLDYEGSDIYYVETEVLSPIYDFNPGESQCLTIHWGACRLSGPVKDVKEGGCSAEFLTVEKVSDQYFHFSGTFGVFDKGKIVLSCEDIEGNTVDRIELGLCNPISTLHLDTVQILPQKIRKVHLRVIADSDGIERILSNPVFVR